LIGVLTEHQIINIYNQLRSALEYLKFKKIIHRDISPDNILIDEKNTVYLSDFGISCYNQNN
jgi:serine/threonine protein kinase